MLRITIDEGFEAVILRLEGRLIGPWIEEVERCWRRVLATLGDRSVHVDLSAVSFVDTTGVALLDRMQKAGFRLARRESVVRDESDEVRANGTSGPN